MIRDQRLDRVGHFHNLPVLLDHPHLTSPELTSMSVQVGRAASVRRVLGRCPPLSHHLSEILAGSSRRASRPCGLVHLPIVFVDTPLWAGHTDLIKMAIGPNPHVVARTMTISSPAAHRKGAQVFSFSVVFAALDLLLPRCAGGRDSLGIRGGATGIAIPNSTSRSTRKTAARIACPTLRDAAPDALRSRYYPPSVTKHFMAPRPLPGHRRHEPGRAKGPGTESAGQPPWF